MKRILFLISLLACMMSSIVAQAQLPIAPPLPASDTAAIDSFQIGTIPNLSVWQGDSIKLAIFMDTGFSVIPDRVVITIPDVRPPGANQISQESPSGNVIYYSPSDSEEFPFVIYLTARKGSTAITDTFLMTPKVHLPSEEPPFGLGLPNITPVPDAANQEWHDYMNFTYVHVNNKLNHMHINYRDTLVGDLNRKVDKNGNSVDTSDRSIIISGQNIVIDSGIDNKIWDRTSFLGIERNDDIEQLSIYADTLTIKKSWNLAQTNVMIRARVLIFDDTKGFVTISTKPWTDSINTNSNQSGPDGLPGGNLTVYAGQVIGQLGTRFYLQGGDAPNVIPNATTFTVGNGGKGGTFTCNISGMSAHVEGGAGGSKSGTKLGTDGASGTKTYSGSPYRWANGLSAQMSLMWAKEAYLRGHGQDVAGPYCASFGTAIDSFMANDAASEANDSVGLEDLQQVRHEMGSIVSRTSLGLDYFGNQPGWVPMLSFESNVGIYTDAIPHALNAMWLSYYLGGVDSLDQNRLDSVKSAVQELGNELQEMESEMNSTRTLANTLKTEIAADSVQIQNDQNRMTAIENALEAQAKQIVMDRHKPKWWQEAAGILSIACKFIPFTPPIGQLLSVGFDYLSQVDFSHPFLVNANLLYDAFSSFAGAYQGMVKAEDIFSTPQTGIFSDISGLLSGNASITNFAQDYKDYTDGKQFYDQTKTSVDALETKLHQGAAPTNEVAIEYNNLVGSNPELNAIIKDLAAVTVDRQNKVQELMAVTAEILALMDQITSDCGIAEGLNTTANTLSDVVLSSRALVRLQQLGQAARERLIRYRYYLAKASEYRNLSSYDYSQLDPRTEEFTALAASYKNTALLSYPDYMAIVKPLYDATVDNAANSIITHMENNYNATYLDSETFMVPRQKVEELLRHDSTSLDLLPLLGPQLRFDARDERIDRIGIAKLWSQDSFGPTSAFTFNHEGHSKIISAGDTVYSFQYNPDLSGNGIKWISNWTPPNQVKNLPRNDKDLEFTLSVLLKDPNFNSEPTDLIYSDPGLWSEVSLKVDSIHSVDSIQCYVVYNFTTAENGTYPVIVDVNDGLMPFIKVNVPDITQRQVTSGQGSFVRYYNANTSLTLTASPYCENWAFTGWRDHDGNLISTNNVLANYSPKQLRYIQATYELPIKYDDTLTASALTASSNTPVTFMARGYCHSTYDSIKVGAEPDSANGDKVNVQSVFGGYIPGEGSVRWEVQTNAAGAQMVGNKLTVSTTGTDTIPATVMAIVRFGGRLDTLKSTVQITNAVFDAVGSTSKNGQFQLSVEPNPSSSFVDLRYTLPDAGPVDIMLLDVTGREVYRAVNHEIENPGDHTITLNPESAGLASGSYFCRLIASGKEDDVKLVIQR